MRRLCSIIPFVLAAAALGQQTAPPAHTRSSTGALKAALQSAAGKSGLIFTGRVVKVDFPGQDDRRDTVSVYFRVKDGVRGTHAGEVIEIREWKGLWIPGVRRYRAGEDYAMFCYEKNTLGVSSPVDGDKGRIHLGQQDQINLRAMRLRGQQHVSYSDLLRLMRELSSK